MLPQFKAIYIASSAWFISIASLFYASIAVSLCLVAWPWWTVAPIFCLLIADYRRVIYKYGLRTHPKAVAIIQQDCDKWQYQLFSGKRYKAKLIKQRSYCCGLVLIMYLQHITGGRYIVIPRDSLSQHNYRFLAFRINI